MPVLYCLSCPACPVLSWWINTDRIGRYYRSCCNEVSIPEIKCFHFFC
jgi:hypothetical protein